MREVRIEAGGVPARIYDPGGAAGLLLLGHGGGHGKDSERFVGLSRRYAEETGLTVVCIDAVDHGERRPPQVDPGLPPRWHSTAAPRMAADWQAIVGALDSIGPALAYVGISMGAIFGCPTVAAMPSIRAGVFGVGGIPRGGWMDDPDLPGLLLGCAEQLRGRQVLMFNMTDDEFFPTDSVHAFFDAIPGNTKRLMFWPGRHDEWPAEAIDQSVGFINRSLALPRD